MSNPLITILGPTASGKTSFAVNLAQFIGGEIISADSRQVYKGMDIGTGKDLKEYNINGKQIPYHLIDIVDAGTEFNVFEFQKYFNDAFNCITERNNIPILCGGTGLYLESVLKKYQLDHVPVNDELREKLQDLRMDELITKLSLLRPLHNTTDIKDKQRLIRALEIALFQDEHGSVNFELPDYKSLTFGINLERNDTIIKIKQRLLSRLEEGMIDEIKGLLDSGLKPHQLKFYGLEYRYITEYICNERSYNSLVDDLNVAIRQFAKRQMTWFRRMEKNGIKIHWIEGNDTMDSKLNFAMNIITSYFPS